MPVFHPKTVWNCTQLNKTKPFVQMSGMNIILNHRIKLQYFKSVFFCLLQTIQDKLLSDMLSSAFRADCIACITNMTTPPDVRALKKPLKLLC